MNYRTLASATLVVFLLSGCMPGMSGGNSGAMSDMDHSQMGSAAATPPADMSQSQTMTETMPMSGTMMTDTKSMSDTMAGIDHSTMSDPNLPIDAHFIDGMIVHHQGAVTMANEVLQKAEHPELKSFAEAIIAAQTQEISAMQGWRKAWYPDLADTGGMNISMGDMQVSDDPSKPFDQRFLEAMIAHHQGAIDMANMALQMNPQHSEIKTLSEAIIQAQQSEIEQMKAWLKAWFGVGALPSSPYGAQLASPVRGLGAQEVDDLLAGRGMGFARMAELNSYPGPRHVLDLQTELGISSAQANQIEAIFEQMSTTAKQLGEVIVQREQQLSAAFAGGAITPAALDKQVQDLADLYGKLRVIHLQAHLQVTPLLTPDQIVRYNMLRDYSGGDAMPLQPGSNMDHG